MTEAPSIQYDMPKAYEPAKVEGKWYQFWLEKNYFRAEIDPKRKPFVVIMPLPNVTGELHIGHALTDTMEDIMTRWHRMKGEVSLWLPGLDHAGIATQVVVERMLVEEGLSRQKLGREKFLKRTYKWAEECRRIITQQHHRLGASCDWSRECFTLDEGPSRAVRTAFVNLYHKGLIYRGERIINWCPRCITALSDLEVEYQELTGHLYYVRYPSAEKSGDSITVATTRPETILGDSAVAVNPKDRRYQGMVGKKVVLPAVGREIPVVADEAVDPEFGTGAVKITPAHDPVDFEVAQRHDLPLVHILNPDATISEQAGAYIGLDRFACRKEILADLEKDGLLLKLEPYSHSVGHCIRCQTVIEPLASRQWFIKIKPLARPAIEAVLDGRISIIPPHMTKTYLNWMENIRDWCISRQLWWGHQIPVWYCDDCGELTVAVEEPKTCRHCGSANLRQDPDVLDTWFSSALWTHSTLGWPDDTEDLRYFYPTTVMETGYDILFFWVARMIMMGLENTADIPFYTVYLHGLVRDEKGEKMSKVRGNVVNPIEVADKYGTDALRFALTMGNTPGNDINLTPSRLEAGRNFSNKLWNTTRFVLRNIEPERTEIKLEPKLPLEDRWILSRLSRIVSSVTSLMQDFQFGEAERQLYDFLWGEFCDWYLEITKIRFRSPERGMPSPTPVLVHVLETSLRLLHPYMPFITEELWQHLKSRLPSHFKQAKSIVISSYPEPDRKALDPKAEQVLATLIEIIHSIRNVRAQYKVPSSKWIEAQIYAHKFTPAITPYAEVIQTLARARPLAFVDGSPPSELGDNTLRLVLKEVEVLIQMETLLDLEAERERFEQEIQSTEAQVARLEARLSDQAFLTKAPEAVVAKERQRLAQARDKLERLKQSIN